MQIIINLTKEEHEQLEAYKNEHEQGLWGDASYQIHFANFMMKLFKQDSNLNSIYGESYLSSKEQLQKMRIENSKTLKYINSKDKRKGKND